MKIFSFIFITIATAALLSCDSNLTYRGYINENLYEYLSVNNKQNHTLVISSSGGRTDISYRIAKDILNNNNHIIVQSECMSACSEYILPAANSIEFHNNPIVGFHWNSLMNRDQIVRFGGDITHCSTESPDNLKSLYLIKNLNTEFWKLTEKFLVLESYEVISKDGECPWKKRVFENRMWLPTSSHLKENWGIKFEGTVCADDFIQCSKKVNKRWSEGTRIVIGDKVHISKGR